MNEKRKRLGKIDFRTFVDTFNTLGKQAAVKYVTDTYGVRYDTIVKRLNKESEYTYNQRRDRYVLKSELDPVPRTGPKGVDPDQHNLNVIVKNS